MADTPTAPYNGSQPQFAVSWSSGFVMCAYDESARDVLWNMHTCHLLVVEICSVAFCAGHSQLMYHVSFFKEPLTWTMQLPLCADY